MSKHHKQFPVDVATPDGKDHFGSSGLTIKSTLSFSDLIVAKYKTVLIPGGDPAAVIGNQNLKNIIKLAHSQKSILAAICAGPVVLEQASILDGKKIAYGYEGPQKEWLLSNGFFKKTELTNEPYIVDDNIITARPDHFIDFAIEVGILAGCIYRERADYLKKYYSGRTRVQN